MKPEKLIENEVRKTMGSLEGIIPVESPKFFYGRLRNRIDSKIPARVTWRLSLAYSTVLLVVLINAYTLFKSYSSNDSLETVEEMLAEDYGYSTSIYEFTEE